ncbi:phosphoribulokinase [Ectobacillus sp. JY-23]|uniref:uridine kinase family protein n=1 Tax=Ectobacillus sp. JY-23 TaxID=2933872 RepID=UPI001FF42634|nr:phosphoribulokinase [Ectobacillus sp. JY-23]UOY92351.1 phosphoribulokinase [Ectobacillus sp. JY-23]
MEKLIKQIMSWLSTTNERIIIGISGHGAAGKTTFAAKLLQQLGRENVNYINTDPYIVSSDIRKRAMIDYIYEGNPHRDKMTACHPGAHHVPSLGRDVQMVRDGLDWMTIDTHYLPSQLISAKKRITIVEGMSMAFLTPALFDLKIYFYTDGDTELMRRLKRDVTERGSDMAYLQRSHQERRIQYEVFMHSYSEVFDVVVKTVGDTIYIEKDIFFTRGSDEI